jgi:hypothetical protein
MMKPRKERALCLAQTGHLLGLFQSHGFGSLVKLCLRLETHLTSTPFAHKVAIVVESLGGQVAQQVELRLISLVDSSQTNASSLLLVHERSQASLVLDNHERNLHLAAQSRQPEDKLNGVDVVGNEHQLSLLLFNQRGNMLKSKLDLKRCLAHGSSTLRSSFLDLLLFGSLCVRTVRVQKSKERHGLVLSDRSGELMNRRRNLEALVKDRALTLDADVTRPFDKPRKVATRWSNVSSDLECPRSGRKQRIDSRLLGRRLFVGLLRFRSFLWRLGEMSEIVSLQR